MIDGKRVVAIVPARGGSKGLPGKNIRSFCGKPLIIHAIDIAKQSSYIDQVFVSTDSQEIMSVARSAGSEIHSRPDYLATDTALISSTIRHFISEHHGKFDYLVLLEATSPLRNRCQVDRCIEVLVRKKADSIATFSKSEPPPTRLWKVVDGMAKPYLEWANPWLPRQQQEDAVYLNGLVYAFNIETFIEQDSEKVFFGNSCAVITEGAAIDIDTLEDFELAEFLMRKRNEII
ncbi:acylneuraminate cytidylyltransferase family protein [Pseudomonas lopnurensis]|uniref:acylneuraminate cytidylyltransferase family protein n=1 Tax=Pseudomonas lopnurensis TaxID=1477517 RepID=UPI0028B21D0E|nr:acylneuraminate cytidylyltransferase family protein [Pseudomonas lopnurensis]